MGGFLGIGESDESKQLKEQQRLAQEEADEARRQGEIRLAEKKAKKGQETAKVKLGTVREEGDEENIKKKDTVINSLPSTLGVGGSKTGVQI